jgi:hypothetical protein
MRRSVFLLVLLVLVGCAAQTAPPRVTHPDWPAFITQASERTQQAYEYAITHPHELEKYPCYCGCVYMGHTSNLSCYVNPTNDGTTSYDNHASGCGICVDITQDVMRLKADKLTSIQIRAYIDQRYSASGPGTHTPLPTS